MPASSAASSSGALAEIVALPSNELPRSRYVNDRLMTMTGLGIGPGIEAAHLFEAAATHDDSIDCIEEGAIAIVTAVGAQSRQAENTGSNCLPVIGLTIHCYTTYCREQTKKWQWSPIRQRFVPPRFMRRIIGCSQAHRYDFSTR